MEKLLKTYEVAAALRVSETTIRKYCREGKLRFCRLERMILIPESAIDEYLKERFSRC